MPQRQGQTNRLNLHGEEGIACVAASRRFRLRALLSPVADILPAKLDLVAADRLLDLLSLRFDGGQQPGGAWRSNPHLAKTETATLPALRIVRGWTQSFFKATLPAKTGGTRLESTVFASEVAADLGRGIGFSNAR